MNENTAETNENSTQREIATKANSISNRVLDYIDDNLRGKSIFQTQLVLVAIQRGLSQRVNATNQKYLDLIEIDEVVVQND